MAGGTERSILIKFIGESKSLEEAAGKAGKSVGDVGLNMDKLVKGAAFAKVTKELVDFGRESVSAAIDDKKAQDQLALALRNTVGASDDLIASVEKSISKLQNQTGTLDDQLRPAFSTLVRATKDTTEATNAGHLASGDGATERLGVHAQQRRGFVDGEDVGRCTGDPVVELLAHDVTRPFWRSSADRTDESDRTSGAADSRFLSES